MESSELIRLARAIRDTYHSSRVDTAELHIGILDQYISLCEKQVIVAGATIATSITLVGFVLQWSVDHRIHQHALDMLLIPSWCCLLVAIYCLYRQITLLILLKIQLVQAISAEGGELLLQDIGLVVQETAAKAPSSHEKERSDLLLRLASEKDKDEKERAALLAEMSKTKRYVWGSVATVLMVLALFLLGLFIVTSLPR